MDTRSPQCRVCGHVGVREWLHPREMMFGSKEQFSYFRCAYCDCLQLGEIPPNLDKYYPNDYYAYQKPESAPPSWKTAIKRKLIYPRLTRHKLGWGGVAGRLLYGLGHGPPFPEWLRYLVAPVPAAGGVLDVGCGSGFHLLALRDCGFSNLLGVDPFISESVSYPGSVRIKKCGISDIAGEFSLITMHHVFEHVENPVETLEQARRLLKPNGQILIRIPLSDSDAAQRYKENWVQLDAPRHITLQTRKSMECLAKKAEMKIARVVYDSTGFQFWGSELYLRDIPLRDSRSNSNDPNNPIFRSDEMESYARLATQLNSLERGDQAGFVLVHCNQ